MYLLTLSTSLETVTDAAIETQIQNIDLFASIISLLTIDNITFIIAVIGFILSLYNFFHERLQNRMKLHLTYKSHFISEHDNSGVTISIAIENLVANPISISRMFLNINEVKIEFHWMPQFVFHSTISSNNIIHDEIKVHTIAIPFTIEGYGVVGGFFYTKHPQTISNEILQSSQTSITIHSNKGIKTYPIIMNNTSRE